MLIKVAITDDHPMILTGLKTVMDSCSHICLTGTYADGHALLAGIEEEVPDVLLLDLQLPDMLGKEVAQRILKQYPEVRIVILTSLEATHHIEEMMEIGCIGYLLKGNTDHMRLVKAVEQAYYREHFIDEALQKQLLNNIFKKKQQQQNSSSLLTRRERQILQLIVEEHTNQDIADKLHVSVRTVDSHRLSLLNKLDAKNTAGLVRKAMELRLLS